MTDSDYLTMDTFELEIVTPEKLMVKDSAEEVQIPGKNGYLGVLPGHAPLITELSVGEITYKTAGSTFSLAVAWGFAEVLPTKVTILAESAERPEDIDLPRCEAAKERAEAWLKNPEGNVNRAMNALKRAEVRIAVAKKAGVRAN